jgi:hypothetical protein
MAALYQKQCSTCQQLENPARQSLLQWHHDPGNQATHATKLPQNFMAAVFFDCRKVAVSNSRGIIFSLLKGMKMIRTLSILERRARYLMIVVAILSVVAVMLYKTGLVATEPAYDHQAWYSFSKHAGFVISTEHGDEAACRSAEKLPSIVCHSGRSLMTSQRKDPFS